MKGAEMIAAERDRQVSAYGFGEAYDVSANANSQLAEAALAYTHLASLQEDGEMKEGDSDWCWSQHWPITWEQGWWKPSTDPVWNLVRAGALIAAEIDRLVALRESRKEGTSPAVRVLGPIVLAWWLIYFSASGFNLPSAGNRLEVVGPFADQQACFLVGGAAYDALIQEQQRAGGRQPTYGPIQNLARCVSDTPASTPQ